MCVGVGVCVCVCVRACACVCVYMSTGISSLSCAFDSYLQDEVVPKAVEIFKVDPQNDGQDPEMEEEEETMAPGKSSQKSTHHDMVERRGWELRKNGKK